MPTPQEILANTLKSQAQGGAAMAGGPLGKGANVPQVLSNNPATRQLLEESIATQSGNIGSVISSTPAREKTYANQAALQSKLDAMSKAAEASAQKQKTSETETKTTPTPTHTGGTTGTEGPAKTPEKSELDLISEGLQSEINAYKTQLDQVISTLPDELKSIVADIQASFERRKREMDIINQNTLSAQKLFGARSGRARYAVELQEQLLSTEEAAGKQRLVDLDVQERQLIEQAKQANTAKKFDLLNKRMAEVEKVGQLKIDAIKEQQQLAYKQEQLLLDKAKEAREAMKFAFEMSQVDNFFKGSDIVSIMKELPEGQTETVVDPGSGKEYTVTGLAQKNNTKQFESVDDQGNMRIINYDTKQGKVTGIETVGKVGKSKTGPTTVILNQQQQAGLETALSKLEETKGGDGFYNTQDVISQLQIYGSKNPGKSEQFLDIIKPKLNPKDPTARQLITGELKDTSGTITITNPNTGTSFTIE